MEEELLQQMIQDRDKKISQVKGHIESRNDEMAQIRQELTALQAQSTDNRLKHRREIADLTKSGNELRHEMHLLEQEVQNQNGSLHGYADVLREAAPDSVDSSYVLRMQSQLCKAMHSMGILEHQMALVKEGSSAVVKALKESINGVVEEKSKIELECMNQMMEMDSARRRAEEEFQGKMDKKKEELMADIEKPPSPEAIEEEAEGKLSEEEMNEYLDELQDAIEEMTEKTEAQLKQIEEMKIRMQEHNKEPGPVDAEETAADEAPQNDEEEIAMGSAGADAIPDEEATGDEEILEEPTEVESTESVTMEETNMDETAPHEEEEPLETDDAPTDNGEVDSPEPLQEEDEAKAVEDGTADEEK